MYVAALDLIVAICPLTKHHRAKSKTLTKWNGSLSAHTVPWQRWSLAIYYVIAKCCSLVSKEVHRKWTQWKGKAEQTCAINFCQLNQPSKWMWPYQKSKTNNRYISYLPSTGKRKKNSKVKVLTLYLAIDLVIFF